MFRSIVVALDLESGGDRALPVARQLAAAGSLPVTLLTVSSPHMSEEQDEYELTRRAVANGRPADGWVIAHHDDAARAIVEHVERRGDALLVMATSAKASFTAQFLGGVTEDILGLIDRPILLIGPRVPPDLELGALTPVTCIERGDVAEAAVPAIVSWMRTFGGSQPWLAELTTSRAESTDQQSLVEPFIILLAAEGIRGVPICTGTMPNPGSTTSTTGPPTRSSCPPVLVGATSAPVDGAQRGSSCSARHSPSSSSLLGTRHGGPARRRRRRTSCLSMRSRSSRRRPAGACSGRPRSGGWPCAPTGHRTSFRSTTWSTNRPSSSAPPPAPSSPPARTPTSRSRSTSTTSTAATRPA